MRVERARVHRGRPVPDVAQQLGPREDAVGSDASLASSCELLVRELQRDRRGSTRRGRPRRSSRSPARQVRAPVVPAQTARIRSTSSSWSNGPRARSRRSRAGRRRTRVDRARRRRAAEHDHRRLAAPAARARPRRPAITTIGPCRPDARRSRTRASRSRCSRKPPASRAPGARGAQCRRHAPTVRDAASSALPRLSFAPQVCDDSILSRPVGRRAPFRAASLR